MDNKNIKDHPPWYARGTPVTNTRDGPAMANHNILLFAICRGPSGEGRGRGKGGSQQAAVGSLQSEVRSRQLAVGSWQSADRRQNPDSYLKEERSRGETKGITRRWLTFKTTFFITQNNVYRQWYALLGSFVVVDADRACPDLSGSIDAVRSGDADLSACAAPDNVEMEMEDNVEFEMVDADSFIDADRACPDWSGSRDAVRSEKNSEKGNE